MILGLDWIPTLKFGGNSFKGVLVSSFDDFEPMLILSERKKGSLSTRMVE